MKSKHLYSLLIISGSLIFPAAGHSAPLVSIGDNTDVFFNGSSSLRWTSNVFRDEDDEVDDLMYTLSPGFEINIGRGLSNADFSIITSYDIIRYVDRDQLDTELFHIKAIGSYSSSRLDLSGSLSYSEYKNNSGDINVSEDQIEYNNYGADLNGEYRFSPKFSVGSGISYTEKEYKTFEDRFADTKTVDIPLDIFYELTPKVDLSVGYTYTTSNIEDTRSVTSIFDPFVPEIVTTTRNIDSYDRDSHFFNIGARGNLLPKLTGFFKIGYRMRDSDDSVVSSTTSTQALDLFLNPVGAPVLASSTSRSSRDDSGMLGLDADFTWAATPKLTANLRLSRNFGVGGEGETTENSSVDLGASYSINSFFAASANLGYTLRDYSDDDRKDNQYDMGLRLSYTPNQYWRFSGGYNYLENDSDRTDGSYINHMFDLTATLRY
jgi:hypothetical protein